MNNVVINRLKKYLAKREDAQFQKRLQKTHHEFEMDVRKQQNYYYGWLTRFERIEKPKPVKLNRPDVSFVAMESCTETFSLQSVKSEIVVFYGPNGSMEKYTKKLIADYFLEHPEVDLVYADEDVITKIPGDEEYPDNFRRIMPYVKPCWSEDTLLSYQYMGSFFAIRRKTFASIPWKQTKDYEINVYDFLLRATEIGKVDQIHQYLFHTFRTGESEESIEEEIFHSESFWGVDARFNEIKNEALHRRGLHGQMVLDEKTGFFHPVYEVEGNPLVSIVIPSKDNPKVLEQCISSVYKLTEYKQFEVILVDNGSSAENKEKLEALQKVYPFTYHYEPMEFNFSKMCNLGVSLAKGAYILLLNDDMEVLEGQWLTRMLGQAMLPKTGAVGAKLLYPDSTIIQHAGVYSTHAGPGHKMATKDDTKSYYYGRNKLVYDLIGVTGACLLIQKAKYEEVGGLYEGLAVTYNDVDLCFKLIEKGYNNVQRNDVTLYHYESLSRGNDVLDEKKLERLNRERNHLFERHPAFARKDPYLGDIYNQGTMGIEMLKKPYHDEPVVTRSNIVPDDTLGKELVHYFVEQCAEPTGIYFDETEPFHYWLSGWFFLRCRDNSRYVRKLLFKNAKGEVWEVPTTRYYRTDVIEVFTEEINVELSGFHVWILEGQLAPDDYELWLYAEDTCLEEKVCCRTEHVLHVRK